MATVNEIIASIEVELEAAKKRRLKAQEELKLYLEQAKQEGRSALSEEERARMDELWNVIDTSKTQVTSIRTKLENARRIKKEEEEGDASARPDPSTRTSVPQHRSYEDSVRVTREERTYTPESDPRGQTFLRDVCRQYMYQDVESASRLARHMQEERVERGAYLSRTATTGTAQFTGLVVPQYLTDMVAPAVANLRPFADICNSHPLPADGMSVNISRITTATSAALQSSEHDPVNSTQMDDTLLTVNVQTAAGAQVVSRQAIDRGSGIEDTIMQDLFARYHTVLDSTLINQATNGLSDVANANTFTDDTDPTGAELYPHILEAAAGVEAALLGMGQPTHAVMHSRRWYWLAKEMTSSWPLINSQGIPVQAAGVNANQPYGRGIRGVLPNGLLVVVDNNVPTTESSTQDEIYVVPSNECHLWEDPNAPAFIRAEQPAAGNLGVLLVLYGYFAYTFARYTNGMQKISGSGLDTPSFS